MKIGQGIQRTAKYQPNNRINIDANDKNQSFSDMLQQNNRQASQEKLNKLLDEIDQQGKKLISIKNLRELKSYKELIKRFIDEVIKDALLMGEEYSYDKFGRSRKYKIIKEIDKKLLELTNLTIEKETQQINLLDQIGEIRGMLVNLYY